MTTAVRGTASRIRWQTSGPSAPSRRTSSKTTSGRLSPTMRIASSPVRASPTTAVPGSRRFRHAGGQADTVVGDADRGLVATDLDTDGRTSSARVFRNVDERLLQRLLEQVTSGRRQTRRVAAEVQLGRDPGELAEV